MQSKPFGLSTKEGVKTNRTATALLRITGGPKTHSNKGQPFLLTTIVAHKETYCITIIPNTIHRTHHDGCRTQPSQWTLAVLGPLTMEEEEEETLGEEEANTTINLLTAFKEMPQI